MLGVYVYVMEAYNVVTSHINVHNFSIQTRRNMIPLVKNVCLRNFDSVSKDHILGMYVYVMEAYTI